MPHPLLYEYWGRFNVGRTFLAIAGGYRVLRNALDMTQFFIKSRKGKCIRKKKKKIRFLFMRLILYAEFTLWLILQELRITKKKALMFRNWFSCIIKLRNFVHRTRIHRSQISEQGWYSITGCKEHQGIGHLHCWRHRCLWPLKHWYCWSEREIVHLLHFSLDL